MQARKNYYSKDEDSLLYKAMERLCSVVARDYPLPNGYTYYLSQKLSYQEIRKWLLQNGESEEDTRYLLHPNPNGKMSNIQPDGGVLIARKVDCSSNIKGWIPLLSCESKHQESKQGNAVERLYKNYNAFLNLYCHNGIFPYVVFCQGSGFQSEYIKNKLRIAIGNDVDCDIDIMARADGRKNGNIFTRCEKWKEDEIFEIIQKAFKQSYSYYLKNNFFS